MMGFLTRWTWVQPGRSVQVRVGLMSLFVIVAILLAAHAVLLRLFERQVTRQFEETLRIQLDQLTASLEVADGSRLVSVKAPSIDPRWEQPYSGMYWQVIKFPDQPNTENPEVYRSRSLWDFKLSLPADSLVTGAIHIHRVLGPAGQNLIAAERKVQVDSGDQLVSLRMVIASDTRDLSMSLQGFTQSLLQYLGALGLILAILVIMQVVYGLAPLRALGNAVTRLQSGQTDSLEGHFPSEVNPLVHQFNLVLAEHRRNLKRARTLAGNLAHSIKTPISVLSNAARDQNLTNEELRDLLQRYMSVAEKQIAWHLKRARMSGSATGQPSSANVSTVLAGVVSVLQRAYSHKGLVITCDVSEQAFFLGEREDLQEILGNLIENACKWSTTSVQISSRHSEQEVELLIDDDGPGVDPARHSDILQRGTRLDEMTPGSGLGLAITSELVELYHGHIDFRRSPQHGLRVSVKLPIKTLKTLPALEPPSA